MTPAISTPPNAILPIQRAMIWFGLGSNIATRMNDQRPRFHLESCGSDGVAAAGSCQPCGISALSKMAWLAAPGYNRCLTMYTPSREEFLAAALRGNLIPVYRELLADSDTPVSAYAALGAGEHSFVLESVVGGANWAAYSFVGVAPRAVVRWQAGTASVIWYDVDNGGPPRTATWQTADPTAALSEVLGELRPVDVAGLPRFW